MKSATSHKGFVSLIQLLLTGILVFVFYSFITSSSFSIQGAKSYISSLNPLTSAVLASGFSSTTIPASLAPFRGPWENRVDLNSDGVYEAYWTGGPCTIRLHSISSNAQLWSSTFSDCTSLPFAPIFHPSFMGNASKDMTIVVKTGTSASNPGGYSLRVADGSTGTIRDFSLAVGDGKQSVLRMNGVVPVDFKLTKYPGRSLFVRTSGMNDNQRGRLFYFPSSSNTSEELTKNTGVVNQSLFSNFAFPGVDIAREAEQVDSYTSIYNRFNFDLYSCPVPSVNEVPASSGCGVPDGDAPNKSIWNQGNGNFTGQVSVGDLDKDGVDDVVTQYLWHSVVYPGRPKGREDLLGAPQFDVYYNPQNDGGSCHSGRHYGILSIEKISGATYPATVDIGGLPVNSFADVYQNVSRNIAVIKTEKDTLLPTYKRSLLWNKPFGTSIVNCNTTSPYNNSIHHPRDGMLRNASGTLQYIAFNRFTQTSTPRSCSYTDTACLNTELSTMTGYWEWNVVRASDGAGVQSAGRNTYVWDMLPIKNSGDVWLIFSKSANVWNLGTQSIESTLPQYRSDLYIARFNISNLTFTNEQKLNVTGKPSIKLVNWQNLAQNISASSVGNIVLSFESGTSHPSFVIDTADGYSLASYVNNVWSVTAQYDKAGAKIPVVQK
jgi:hypothetical protein